MTPFSPRRLLWGGTLALSGLLASCAAERRVIAQRPPDPQEEITPSIKPGGDVFWKSGHWACHDDSEVWFWVGGSWEQARDGWLWLPGHWEEVTDEQGQRSGWTWVDERWERLPDNVR